VLRDQLPRQMVVVLLELGHFENRLRRGAGDLELEGRRLS
jgi:hypothetical protein